MRLEQISKAMQPIELRCQQPVQPLSTNFTKGGILQTVGDIQVLETVCFTLRVTTFNV